MRDQEIHHEYAYHFKMSERSKKHHSGLDYTKCVIITKTEYISEESPVIDQGEYRELVRNIGKVIDSVIQFIDEKVIKNYIQKNSNDAMLFLH